MNVREMHIEIEQSTQLIASNRKRRLEPEEIDWVLNKIQNRYIRNQLRPRKDEGGGPVGGFELDQIGADNIRTLVVPAVSLTPYIDPGESRYKCFLPNDYAYLLSDWSYTTKLCGATPAETAKTLYVTALRQEYSAGGSPEDMFYQEVIVDINGKRVTVPDDLPYGNAYVGYLDERDISFLVPWIMLKGGYWWERFDTLKYPGHYLRVDETPFFPSDGVSITVDGTVYQHSDYQSLSYTVHAGAGKFYDNRLVGSSRISGMNSTAFIKTAHYSPISELSSNILYVYRDSSFTVNSVGISYIRKPLPISLSLNTDSELPEESHWSICDLASEYIKGRLENAPGQQIIERDNDKRVVL